MPSGWFWGLLGKDGNTQLAVDAENFAARISNRPQVLGASGASYGLSVQSGIMAAGLAANSEIFQARWTSATKLLLLRSIQISASRNTTAFATGQALFRLAVARSWSVDGGSGTPVVFSTNNTNKKRTSFGLSAFSDTGVRFSSTAALTAGTKTIDTNDVGALTAFLSSGATTVPDTFIMPPGSYLWQRNSADEYPFTLAQNEGLVIRASVPATGTWNYCVQMEWAEVVASEINW
jgi:hypothetical protein